MAVRRPAGLVWWDAGPCSGRGRLVRLRPCQGSVEHCVLRLLDRGVRELNCERGVVLSLLGDLLGAIGVVLSPAWYRCLREPGRRARSMSVASRSTRLRACSCSRHPDAARCLGTRRSGVTSVHICDRVKARPPAAMRDRRFARRHSPRPRNRPRPNPSGTRASQEARRRFRFDAAAAPDASTAARGRSLAQTLQPRGRVRRHSP